MSLCNYGYDTAKIAERFAHDIYAVRVYRHTCEPIVSTQSHDVRDTIIVQRPATTKAPAEPTKNTHTHTTSTLSIFYTVDVGAGR